MTSYEDAKMPGCQVVLLISSTQQSDMYLFKQFLTIMWPSDSLCYFPRQVQHSPRRIQRRQDVRWILFPLESHTQRCQKIGFAVFWLRQATSPCILCSLQTWRNIYSDQHFTISCSFRGRLRLGHYCKIGVYIVLGSLMKRWRREGDPTLQYSSL